MLLITEGILEYWIGKEVSKWHLRGAYFSAQQSHFVGVYQLRKFIDDPFLLEKRRKILVKIGRT